MKRKDEFLILTNLKKELGGKCGHKCPMYISEDLYEVSEQWNCIDCEELFDGIFELYTLCPRDPEKICPCYKNPQVAMHRLNERILELLSEMPFFEYLRESTCEVIFDENYNTLRFMVYDDDKKVQDILEVNDLDEAIFVHSYYIRDYIRKGYDVVCVFFYAR